jgi:hypothetical protein
MPNVRTTPVRIRVSEEGQIALVRAALEVNRERCERGIDADGRDFPPGKGDKARLDMHDTGRLLSDVQVYGTRYQFMAPHASAVQDKYNFAGVNDEAGKAEIERRVQAILDREITSEDGR